MSRAALSVDYGTSNTVAVLRWPDGRTRPLLFDGSPLLPSAVLATPDGRILVGRDAERGVRADPGRYEPNPKRMVDAGSLLLGERDYPVVDLIAAVLQRVRAEAARTAGEPDRVTLTCPASWGSPRRQVLETAATIAGFQRPVLVPEPVAAATYFAGALGNQVLVGQSVVVYDLGAGTFDVSVVRRAPAGFTTVASDGLDDVGGVDLDGMVVDLVGAAVAAAAPRAWQRLRAPATDDDRRSARLFWDDARAAKETLSRQPVAAIHVPIVERQVHVTREEFERAAAPALERTAQITEATLRSLGPGWRHNVVGIFLVGGSSRVPLAATLLHRHLGIAPTVIEQPEIVVAEGGLDTAPPARPDPPPGGLATSSGPAAALPRRSNDDTRLAPIIASPPLWRVTVAAAVDEPEPDIAVPSARSRRRGMRLLVVGAVVAVLLVAIGATWYRQRDQELTPDTAAFGHATELRDFAARFIDDADRCRPASMPTHDHETGLELATVNPPDTIVRCTGTQWTGYFYDLGTGDSAINTRYYLLSAAWTTADLVKSWGPTRSQRPGGTKHPAKVEFRAGDGGAVGIYWEPDEDRSYQAILAATLVGPDPDQIRRLWQDNAK